MVEVNDTDRLASEHGELRIEEVGSLADEIPHDSVAFLDRADYSHLEGFRFHA